MRRTIIAAMLAATVLTACGAGNDAAVSSTDPGQTSGSTQDGDAAMTDDDHRERARQLLGMAEGELPPDVRVGRRGDEQMMLTEDYVIGRRTVELDDDGSGTFVVTAVTVELESGPERITS